MDLNLQDFKLNSAEYGQITLQNKNRKICMEPDGKFKVDGRTVTEDLELYYAFRDFFGLISHKDAINNLISNPEGATR